MRITPLDAWTARRIGLAEGGLTREAIEAFQLEALRETVRHACEKGRFYARHLGDLTERDLTCLSDLTAFPFTSPEHVRGNPFAFLCVSRGEIARVVTLATSGTTGEPKRIHFTREDLEATADFFHHGVTTLAGPGDAVLSFYPGGRTNGVNHLLSLAVERAGGRWVPAGEDRRAGVLLELMERERVDVLAGAPVQVLALARVSAAGAFRGKSPRSVLFSTDRLPGSIRREIERLWGCEVFNHYGMTETGFGGALECSAHFGCHPRESDLYFEVVHPDTGRPLPEGETGELVFTTLSRRGMPFIRYRTGDLARFLPGRCPCGTALRSLGPVTGRIGGRVAVPGCGSFGLEDLDEALFGIEGVLDFHAECVHEGNTWRLCIELSTLTPGVEGLEALLRHELERTPSIGSGMRSGLLALDLSVSVCAEPRADSREKRVLTVHRT